MTYGFLILFALELTISYRTGFVNVDLYYLQLFTIIVYHLNAHIMLLRYVIYNYIRHMGSQNYEIIIHVLNMDFTFHIVFVQTIMVEIYYLQIFFYNHCYSFSYKRCTFIILVNVLMYLLFTYDISQYYELIFP